MMFFLKPGIIDGRVQANAGHHVLQHAPRRAVIKNVIRDDGPDAGLRRRICDALASASPSFG